MLTGKYERYCFLTNKSLESSKLTTCYKRCFRKWTILDALTSEKWKKIMNNQHCHFVMKGASLSILNWDLLQIVKSNLSYSGQFYQKLPHISQIQKWVDFKETFSSSSTATGTAQVLLSKCRSNFNKQTFCSFVCAWVRER